MLSVPKGGFKGPSNAPTQKIIGWEIFLQSLPEHFIPVRKQVSKTGSNMHQIRKIRQLYLVNFLMKFKKMQSLFHFEHD